MEECECSSKKFMLHRRGSFHRVLYYAWFPLMAAHSLTRNLRSSDLHMQSLRPSQPPLFDRSFRGNKCTRFDLKACGQSPKDNCSSSSLGINAKGPTLVRRPLVLNNVEVDLVDGIDRRYSTTVHGETQWRNPLTFHDLSSRDKLVVAVDIDEGLYFLSSPSLDFNFVSRTFSCYCSYSSSEFSVY